MLIHDAIMYMTTLDDLVAALATARAHVAPAGAVLVLPDHVTETYAPGAEVGGHDAADGSGRGLRYLEWSYPPAEGTCAQVADFAILLRERDGAVRVVHDRHVWGLFPRDVWREAFHRAFQAPRSCRIRGVRTCSSRNRPFPFEPSRRWS